MHKKSAYRIVFMAAILIALCSGNSCSRNSLSKTESQGTAKNHADTSNDWFLVTDIKNLEGRWKSGTETDSIMIAGDKWVLSTKDSSTEDESSDAWDLDEFAVGLNADRPFLSRDGERAFFKDRIWERVDDGPRYTNETNQDVWHRVTSVDDLLVNEPVSANHIAPLHIRSTIFADDSLHLDGSPDCTGTSSILLGEGTLLTEIIRKSNESIIVRETEDIEYLAVRIDTKNLPSDIESVDVIRFCVWYLFYVAETDASRFEEIERCKDITTSEPFWVKQILTPDAEFCNLKDWNNATIRTAMELE